MTDIASRTISLNDISVKYMQALQRLSDLMVFNWAGVRMVNEQGYEELSKGISGLPSTGFHLSFNTAKEESERWILKQSLNEILGLAVIFVDDIRKLCGMVAFNVARATGTGDLASLAAEVNTPPSQIELSVRLKQLTEKYGVTSPMEKEIMSLTGVGRCLFQSNGVVGPGAPIQLHVKAIQPPAAGETQPSLVDYQRSWSTNDKISLSREEHAAIFTTVSVFFGSMLGAVQQFAKRSGLPEEPSQQ